VTPIVGEPRQIRALLPILDEMLVEGRIALV
jgi:hypothetical protein